MIEFTNLELTDDRVAFVEAKVSGWAGDLSITEFHNALQDNDIPEKVWPNAPSDNRCLERALHSLRGQRSLVRPLAKGKGFSLILESAENLDLEHTEGGAAHNVELTCKVEKGENKSALSRVRVTPQDHPAVPLIQQEFVRYRGESEGDGLFKCSQDLSFWFSQTIVPWCRGVATRTRGGSYYILKGQYLDRMIRVTNALKQASVVSTTPIHVAGQPVTITKVLQGGRVILKPEVASVSAVEIMIDNIIDSCDKVCDRLDEDLRSDNLGIRGLDGRKRQAERTLTELQEYEQVLGTSLTDIKGRLSEITSGIGIAQLKLMASKEKSGK